MMIKFAKSVCAFLSQPFEAVADVEERINRIRSQQVVMDVERRMSEWETRQDALVSQMQVIQLDTQLTKVHVTQIKEELQAQIDKLEKDKTNLKKHRRERGKTATGLFSVFVDGKEPPNLRRKL